MANLKLVAASLALICLSSVASVSPVTKCKSGDSKCAKDSATAFIPKFAAGLSEYKVKPLDPVTFKKIDASSPNLKLVLTDVTLTGMKNCVATKIKREPAKSKLFVKLLCSVQLEGQYEMKGQLLILPIEGKGPLHVTLRKAEFSIDVDMGETEKGGKKHWDVKSFKHTFELKDKSDVVFENLFNGNAELSKATNEVISKSGNEVILEVGGPVITAVVTKVFSNVDTFFKNIPVEELEQ